MAKDKGACSYPAADFEQLSMMLQRKYHFASYQKPILVGYSYGAVFIYGLIAQAPAGTFKGGISLGFCPDIDLKKPFVKAMVFCIMYSKKANRITLTVLKNFLLPLLFSTV
jgi:type IV secretory pathway VirJ component